MITKKLNIYLDFDGTVVEHQFPKMGRCNFGCFEVIKKLQLAGHKIILNTVRPDISLHSLQEALNLINHSHWRLIKDHSQRNEFRLEPISQYASSKIGPYPLDFPLAEQTGELFIDDNSTNTPLKPAVMTGGNIVDWDKLDILFTLHGLYKNDLL